MDVSVIISTYNRAAVLRETLQDILAAGTRASFDWEIVVVDNNSTDDTKAVITALSRSNSRIRYVHEPRQGVCFGRNTGVEHSRGEILLFTDDDVAVDGDWLKVAGEGFQDPEIEFIIGRILPLWTVSRPDWLPDQPRGALGICEFGDSVLRVDRHGNILPMTANLAIRREVFYRTGGFDPELGPRGRHRTSADGRGYFSGEDYEFGLRILEAGYQGIYFPSLVVCNRIGPERVTKEYYRKWMLANGQANSMIGRDREGHLKHCFGVPRYLFREAVKSAILWAGSAVRGRGRDAFFHELLLWHFRGFVRDRWSTNGAARAPEA